MASLRHYCASLLTGFCLAVAISAQELPTKSGPEDLEAEAKRLMDDLPILDKEEAIIKGEIDQPDPNEDPNSAVERLKAAWERAQAKQKRWEKLARQGVLSRMEAESCVVEVADAFARHEQARVSLLRQQLADIQDRVSRGEADKTLAEAAAASLQSAMEMAALAEKQAHLSRLELARNNLDRHRKLHAAGLVSRVQLQRAESRVQKLEAAGQLPKEEETKPAGENSGTERR